MSLLSLRDLCAFGRTPVLLVAGIAIASTLPAQESAKPANVEHEKTVLIVGDSLAAGHGLDPAEAFPAILRNKLEKEGWNFKVVNAGVSGDTSAGGLRRMDWLLRRRIDVLVVELGGNDGLRGIAPEATRTNIQGIIERARDKYPKVRVVIAGMKMPPNLGSEYGDKFEKVFPEVAEKNHAQLIPFLLEGVGGHPELNQGDRIHPNAEGHQILAANVWKVLRPILQEEQE